MKLSHYLKQYSCEERPNYITLFSTKNASKILLPQKKFQSIEQGTLSPSDETTLAELGMIVPDREEEKQSVLSLIDEVNKKSTGLNALIILNLDCNFACVYCYEGDMKGKLYMSGETASCVIDFIKQRFTEDKTSLLIDFYGGEPLLSTPLIKSISRELQSFCQERGASYGSTLVTNGSLFTKKVAEDLVPLGLESIKITLDGPEHIHNRYRPFKSGKGSFATIIRNIKDTCGIVKVGIGGNFERDNWEKFVLLLDYMEEEGLTREKIASVKFDPVMNRTQGEPSPTDYRDGCMSINEPWVSEASLFLREEIMKRGYNIPNMGPIICAVERKDSYTINYDGMIYKCPAFVGKKGFAVGDVRSGVEDYTASYRLGIWKNEECSECVYLPLCFGGCRYATFVRQGNIDALDCEKAYLDTSLETLIKQEIQYGQHVESRSVKGEDGENIDVTEMKEMLDGIFMKHFPAQFKSFKAPSLERMISCYNSSYTVVDAYIHGTDWNTRQCPRFVESPFFTAAIIRYLDDFIDNALWPSITEFDPAELLSRFRTFMEDSLKICKYFDPEVPDRIKDLPILEMQIALYPDQDNFDQNFIKLFEAKSFDLFYIYERIRGNSIGTVDRDKLARIAIMEHIRDFSADAIAHDKDLNLYKHIRDNHLNPQQLINYLIDVYRKEDPTGYSKVKESDLFDGIEIAHSSEYEDRRDTAIPFHESFSAQFTRAIRLLRELL